MRRFRIRSRSRGCEAVKFARSSQQIGQDAAALPDMGGNKYRSRMIGRQRFRDRAEGLETTGRGADNDYILAWGSSGFSITTALRFTPTSRIPAD
jgi:hypothetical protein